MGLDYFFEVADRVYDLIRAFWIRERGGWSRELDYPPPRWFEEPLTKGPMAGSKLDLDGYDRMLSWYYEIRGWDWRGVPTRSTLAKSGLDYVARELEREVRLS